MRLLPTTSGLRKLCSMLYTYVLHRLRIQINDDDSWFRVGCAAFDNARVTFSVHGKIQPAFIRSQSSFYRTKNSLRVG